MIGAGGMTMEELEQAMEEARGRRDAAISELKLLSVQYDEALTRARAQEAVANLSDNEKAALMQALSVPGVPSTAAAGEPSGA